MGVFFAQEFESMRGEVDDDEDAVRPQHPRGFGDRRGGPVGIMQDLMDDDRIERGVGKRQLIHVAEPNDAVVKPGPFEIDAGHGEHLARLVDPQRMSDARAENLDHAAGPGADIEQILRRGGRDDLGQRRLDLALVDVERADLVPLRGIVAEIGGGEFGALALDRGQPLQIKRDRLVGLAAGGDQMPGERACRAARTQAIEDPAAFAKPVEQTGLAEQLQMAGNARLALPEDLRQFADRQLAAGAQHQEAQPRRLGHRAQGGEHLAHRRTGFWIASHS